MKKEVVFIISNLIFIFLMINFISADFEIGNASYLLDKQYRPNGNIKGWINVSFSDEPINSLFKYNLGDFVVLWDLLEENRNFNYYCDTAECTFFYSKKLDSGNETKKFYLSSEKSKVVGLVFNGEEVEIKSVDFVLESDVKSSCENQIEIDILNDGYSDFMNNKSTTGDCSSLRSYGCYNESEWTGNKFIIQDYPSNKYCQRISLQKAPGFKIGAWIERNGETGNLKMSLYTLDREMITGANCILPSDEEEEIYCEIDYFLEEPKEVYVCIYSDNGDGKAKIKGYSKGNGCGFYGNNEEEFSYKIFAEPIKFGDVGTLHITNSLKDITIAEEINDYINLTYGGKNCTSDCVVPIGINSKKGQNIILKDLSASYDISGGSLVESFFYDLEEKLPRINSEFQKLYLDSGNFSVPSNYGFFNFTLWLNNKMILSENLSVEKIPTIRGIIPTSTAHSISTKFKILLSSYSNITQYRWEFGDNKSETTLTNEVTHVYNSSGIYDLRVTITDFQGINFSESFEIKVGSLKGIIEEKIDKSQKNLEKIKSQINEFTTFQQTKINSVLDISDLELKLTEIQREYSSSNTEKEFEKIFNDLLELQIPNSVHISKKTISFPFYPSSEKINLDILAEIEGGDYDISNEKQYVDAILLWNQENIQTTFDFNEISASYDNYEDALLKIFKLNLEKSDDIDSVPYLIIQDMENLEFDKNYLEERSLGYVYINLEGIGDVIIFSTTADIEFNELPAFISPGIERLRLIERPGRFEKKDRWLLFIVILIFLLILVSIIYIILQEWYKRRYETYLFKDRNNLYNILSYIKTSKNRGMEDSEIKANLKKAGWSSEQINYAMKKYAGKRVGMFFEIPIDKILNRFKKKKKIEISNKRFIPPKSINQIPPKSINKRFIAKKPEKRFIQNNMQKKFKESPDKFKKFKRKF